LPGKLLAHLFLWAIRRSAFVREARRNIALWGQAMEKWKTRIVCIDPLVAAPAGCDGNA
jgi:hypothetical protein